ncbi:hypothetical protein D3C78_1435730 [compost metagenome]
MMIAPFAARMPYKAAAAGPFNTETLSISSEFISIARLEGVASEKELVMLGRISCVELSTGIPSTTNKGELLPKTDVLPLMRTEEEPPGEPPLFCT